MARSRAFRAAWVTVLFCGLGLGASPTGARAEGEVVVTADFAVRVFPRSASGSVPPTRTIGGSGNNTLPDLDDPAGVVVDLVHNELILADEGDDVIAVFAWTAGGNAAPLRRIRGGSTGLSDPVGLGLDPVNGEIFVANRGNDSITVYGRTANGNVAPLRTISGPATGLDEPGGLVVDPVNRELIVVNEGNDSVRVFALGAQGDAAPLRSIINDSFNTGSTLSGLNDLRGVALDLTNGEILVTGRPLVEIAPGVFSFGDGVQAFARTANGDVKALRTLTGAGTGLADPGGVAVDAVSGEIWVVNRESALVTVHARTATGNASPQRILAVAGSSGSPNYLALTSAPPCGPVAAAAAIAAPAPVLAAAPGEVPLVAAILPSSRSVRVGCPATAFVTIINAGGATATGVGIGLASAIPATLTYQQTDPLTNAVVGTPNTPVDIAPSAFQTYVIAVTPTAELAPTDVGFVFAGANTAPVDKLVGINTLLLSGTSASRPDVVALVASPSNDGIVKIPGVGGTGVFAVATVNVGFAGAITATVDTGGASPPLSAALCQTNPATAACVSPLGPSVATAIGLGETPTFAVFVTATGPVPLDPAVNRLFFRIDDADGITRGATSIAAETVAVP